MTTKLSYPEFRLHEAGAASHLVCSASFEARAQKIPLLFRSQALQHSYVLHNEENHRVESSRRQLVGILEGTVQSIGVFGSDPIRSADVIAEVVKDLAQVEGKHIFIDISTMMRETMLMVLGLLHLHHPEYDQVWIGYNSAGYPQAEGLGGDDVGRDANLPVLSYGVSDVRSVVGYPGDIDLSGDRHLLILMGFEVSRAEGIIYAKDPAFLSIGVGAIGHSTSSRNAKLNRHFADQLRSRYTGPVREFNIYPDDAELTAKAIESEISSVGLGKPILSAMNTKVTACGAAIAAWRDPSIELVYAQPALYNHKDYSQPTDELYLFRLPRV